MVWRFRSAGGYRHAVSARWYEVWVDEGQPVPYLLLLRPGATSFEGLDPREGNRRVFVAERHEDAAMWLCEDEFVRVGRKELDEG